MHFDNGSDSDLEMERCDSELSSSESSDTEFEDNGENQDNIDQNQVLF